MIKNKIIFVDIDGTLTKENKVDNINDKKIKEIKEILLLMRPNISVIKKINILAKQNRIILYTSRSDLYEKETINWLKQHSIVYEQILFNKPFYDILIDDKSILPTNMKELL